VSIVGIYLKCIFKKLKKRICNSSFPSLLAMKKIKDTYTADVDLSSKKLAICGGVAGVVSR
jgi:hypothetical protein